MVVRFTTTYAISAYHHWYCEFKSHSWLGVKRCDKVCQWLVAGRWFSPGTPVSATNKTDCHNISRMLLKVVLSTIKPNHQQTKYKNCMVSQISDYPVLVSIMLFLYTEIIEEVVSSHTFTIYTWFIPVSNYLLPIMKSQLNLKTKIKSCTGRENQWKGTRICKLPNLNATFLLKHLHSTGFYKN